MDCNEVKWSAIRHIRHMKKEIALSIQKIFVIIDRNCYALHMKNIY